MCRSWGSSDSVTFRTGPHTQAQGGSWVFLGKGVHSYRRAWNSFSIGTEWWRQSQVLPTPVWSSVTLWEGRQLGWASTAADTQHTTGLPLQDSGVGSSEWGSFPGTMLSALLGLRQEGRELEVSLVYKVSSRVAWTLWWDPVFFIKKKNLSCTMKQ